MRLFLRNPILRLILALLAGLGLGLAYSWLISPVTYVDANPAILRADFKDQYRVVIAASYTASHDLARARARLELLSDTDPIGELSAQAQRMLGAGESFEDTQPLAQLAADLQQGFANNSITSAPTASAPFASTPFVGTPFIALSSTPDLETPFVEEATPTATAEFSEPPFVPTVSFEQTLLAPQQIFTSTPRPTSTPKPAIGAPFTLVGQDTVCDVGLQSGLLQFILMNSRRRQVAGIEIIVTWSQGEDHFFTGFKPELGDGYADFIMQADTVYSVRVVEGGSFVPNISAPICADPNGASYPGGLLLTFQQP
ncbi:MAG: hypothetical protein Q7T89_16270 [Anaerolineales bacterium]|nr:hypothetical protein [Anaerolineales bacterium]